MKSSKRLHMKIGIGIANALCRGGIPVRVCQILNLPQGSRPEEFTAMKKDPELIRLALEAKGVNWRAMFPELGVEATRKRSSYEPDKSSQGLWRGARRRSVRY